MSDKTTPGPGIYPDVPMDEYLAWECYSRSWVIRLEAGDSPRVVQHANAGGGGGQTQATAFGTALHLAVLEPTAALTEIAVSPAVDRRTKAGKETWAAFSAENEGRLIVKAAEWALIEAMAASLAADPVCSGFLTDLDDREVSVVWDEPVRTEDGVDLGTLPFKARFDGICPDQGIILDLKITRDPVRPRKLAYAAETYGYAFQSVLYPRAWRTLAEIESTLITVWVSKEPPHDCLATELDLESHEAAAEATDRALRDLLFLHETYGAGWDGARPWPGAGTEREEVMRLRLPNLARRYRREDETWPTTD